MTGFRRVAAATVLLLGLAAPTAALANDYVSEPPVVSPTTTEAPTPDGSTPNGSTPNGSTPGLNPSARPRVLSSRFDPAARPSVLGESSGTLAFTGADVVQLSLVGVGALGIGIVAVRRGRRTRTA